MAEASSMRRVAVVDVGSNSIKLLVAEGPPLHPVHENTLEVRIGGGLTGGAYGLSPEAIRTGTEAIRTLVDEAAAFTPDRLRVVATSAVREAGNGRDLQAACREATGFTLEVLSGEEEALGIARGVAGDPSCATLPAFEVVDLGGGSLEVIRFRRGRLDLIRSFPVGAVRLLERYVPDPDQPVTPKAVRGIQACIQETLTALPAPDPEESWQAVGTGGAFTVSRAIFAQRAGLALEKQSHFLSLPDLDALCRELCALPMEARMRIPGLPAARADILPVALVALVAYGQARKVEGYHHSLCNLRYGLATALVEDPPTERGAEV
ncbi:MAG: Ppx/GppA phosphatase family protein [Opitutales bacterium]